MQPQTPEDGKHGPTEHKRTCVNHPNSTNPQVLFQYRNGIGVCLFIMSVADLVSLASLCAHFATDSSLVGWLSPRALRLACPLVSFISHTAYTQSMWCWWLMSALRYMATRRPLQYTTLWRLPCIVMGATFLCVACFNSFLVAMVRFDPLAGQCYQQFSYASRAHRLVDVVLSFCVPTLLVLYMDLSVLCCRIQSPLADPMLQIVINRPAAEKVRKTSVSEFCLSFPTPTPYL